MRIGIDIDLTLVDVSSDWMDWMKGKCTSYDAVKYKKDMQYATVDYNLSNYFTFPEGIDPMSWWHKHDIYDNYMCYEGAIKVVKGFYESGHEIVFISHCMYGHITSKYELLRRSFPFIPKEELTFVATRNKGIIDVEVLIDDRLDFLQQMKPSVNTVLFETPYTQNVDFSPDNIMTSWV